MNKVYCKNCKWFCLDDESGIFSYAPTRLYCEFPKNPKNHITGYRGVRNCPDNKEFNCKNYQRKWWKFWLKKILLIICCLGVMGCATSKLERYEMCEEMCMEKEGVREIEGDPYYCNDNFCAPANRYSSPFKELENKCFEICK